MDAMTDKELQEKIAIAAAQVEENLAWYEKNRTKRKKKLPVITIKTPKLTEKQKEILSHCKFDSPTEWIVVCTGRQVGKSVCGTMAALYWAINKNAVKVGLFLPTLKQAKKQFKVFEKGLRTLKHVEYNKTDLTITFPNKSFIQFYSAETDSCRGNTFDYLIVDEACFIDSDVWYAAINPTIAVKMSQGTAKCLILSTPKSKNWFYSYFMSDDMENKVSIKFTSEEGGLISKEYLRQQKAISKDHPHIYGNEYLAEFLEDGQGIFEWNNGCVKVGNNYELTNCTAGIDWGMENDSTVLSIFNDKGNLVFLKRWKNAMWMDVLREIAGLLRQHKVQKAFSETNGIGQMPTKELKQMFPQTYGWHTSASNKENIIQKLAFDIKNQSITLLNDPVLLKELESYSIKIVGGKISYGAREGMHDDCVMATAIANYNRRTNIPMFMM